MVDLGALICSPRFSELDALPFPGQGLAWLGLPVERIVAGALPCAASTQHT